MRKNYKKKKQIKELIIILIFFIFLTILSSLGILNKFDFILKNLGIIEEQNTITSNQTNLKNDFEVKNDIVINKDKLNILFFDVGQADCELIINKEKTILIDSGNSKDGEIIANEIKSLGISKLDYVIGTHIHEDHIGGMSYIIDAFDVGEYYMPYNTITTANYYENLLNSLANKKFSINEANIGDKIQIDDLILEIMAVDNSEPDDANDASIVAQITYGNQKFLFMGDATTKNEDSRKWNDVDLIKVGHHGSNTSSSESFLKQVLPEISIISVGKDNNYGLPKDNIIERYQNIGSKIYRTDKDGTIQAISDGNTMEILRINASFDGNK